MSHKAWAAIVVIAFFACIGLALLLSRHPIVPEAALPEPVEVEDLTGQVIYASGEHGFIVMYPQSAYFYEGGAPDMEHSNEWAHGREGFPVIAVMTYELERDFAFPRYFAVFVRIGVSDAPEDLASCTEPLTDQGEERLPDREIQGVTWSAFSFGDAGMGSYEKGVSYRTVHEGKCFALEKFEDGTLYREEPHPEDKTEAELAFEFERLDPIVASFRFTTPEE